MEHRLYMRYSMAGWIVLAVVSFSKLARDDRASWVDALRTYDPEAGATLAIAVVSIVAGLGAPPAIGFLLDRVSSLFHRALRELDRYSPHDAAKQFFEIASTRIPLKPEMMLDDRDLRVDVLLDAFLHSCATSQFIDNWNWRFAQLLSSLTAIWAIIVGLAVAAAIDDAWSWWVAAVSTVLLLILAIHVHMYARRIKLMGEIWVAAFGASIAATCQGNGSDKR